jgi:glycerol-3-phosphate acyltransferase PlsY
MWPYYLLYALIGYLIGSIPFGYIIVKLRKGIDIRTVGSGNIGATNVGRVIGLPWGILCFLLDTAKGFIPTTFTITNCYILWNEAIVVNQDIIFEQKLPDMRFGVCIGLGLIIGHLFPIYLRFKGGKGVATALGVFLVLTPLSTCIALVVWLIFILAFRYVSVASIMAAVALSASYILLECYQKISKSWNQYKLNKYNDNWLICACIIVSVLVILRHIPNIKRLINGTEPKVSFKKKDETQN